MKRVLLLLISVMAFTAAHATVTTQATSVSFTCTGSVGPYPFTFSASSASAITVTQNSVTVAPGNYTVVPVNNNYDNGGSVTLNTACPSGQTLVLARNTPVTQTSVFTDNMPVPMKTMENGLDKLTEIAQELGIHGGTGSGTVGSVAVATANGLQGTVTNPNTTAVITLSPDSTHVIPTNTGNGVAYLNSAGAYTVPPGTAGAPPAAPAYAVQYAGPGATAFNADSTFSFNPTTHALSALLTNGTYSSDVAATGGGNNGISNLLAGSTCLTAGCFFTRGMTSTDTENLATAISAGSQEYIHGLDNTYGLNNHFYRNAGLSNGGAREVNTTTCLFNDQPTNPDNKENCKANYYVMATPGNYVNGSPQGSHMYNNQMWTYGRSISSLNGADVYAFKVGDSFDSYHYFYFRNGEVQGNDEGVKGSDLQVLEAPAPFGTVTTGGAGATTVKSNFTGNNGNQGDGYYLVDTSQILASGLLVSNASPTNPALNTMTTSDTHAVSTAWGTLSGSCGANGVARNAPVGTTCAITTTSGTWSAAAGATVCIGDYRNEPEQVGVTAASSTSLTMGVTFLHQTGTPIYQGGLCGGKAAMGYGLTDPSSTHQMTTYWVAGSTSATTFDYVVVFKSGQVGNLAITIPVLFTPRTTGLLTRSSNIVSGGIAAGSYPLNGSTAPGASTYVVSGASDSTFNGVISGQTISGNTITYPQTGANSTATGAVITSVGYNNYVIYCGAETVAPPPMTLSSTNRPVLDGTLNLEPNNCNWTPGDADQQPNSYASNTFITDYIGSGFTPAFSNLNTAHATVLGGMMFSGAPFYSLSTSDSPSAMLGYGGQIVPRVGIDTGNNILTTFANIKYAPANAGNIFNAGCPEEGCANAYQNYNAFLLQYNGGSWVMSFSPKTGAMNISAFGIGNSQMVSGVQGTTGTKFLACTGTFTVGHVVAVDANGNCVDGGAPVAYPGAGVPVSTGSAWGTSIAAANIALINAGNPFTGNNSFSGSTLFTASTVVNGAPFGVGSSTLATSSANVNSPPIYLSGSYWTGTAANIDEWQMTNVLGTGANPTATLTFGRAVGGTTGGVSVAYPAIATHVYTVGALPSASSLPAGTQVTVSDDTGLPTSNTCTGGGAEYAIAMTNGTSWTCH